MLIQKVFHVRQSLNEVQARLSNSQSVSRRFGNLCEPNGSGRLADGRSHGRAMSLSGFRDPFEIELLPTEDDQQVLFHSIGGEMELCGLMELLPVRDHLTEVQLTLEYEIQSPLRRLLDRLAGGMNRRIDRQIMAMKRQMEDDGDHEGSARFIPAPLFPAPVLSPNGALNPNGALSPTGAPHPAR
jgi:hypothetical protein